MSPEDELMTDRALQGPLTGLVVADFSRILAGPYATMLLADMGATVIKVESPAGDDTRTWMPPVHRGELLVGQCPSLVTHRFEFCLKLYVVEMPERGDV